MTGYQMPIFSKGNLLSQEMLEALKNYEIEFAQNCYTGYSDGIITGAKIHVTEGLIYIGRGIIKFKDRLFFIEDNTKVAITPADEWQAVKVVLGDVEKSKEFEKQEMTIEITKSISRENGKIELCRVRLQDGAKLRSEYVNLEDMNTEFDTIHLIEAQWAAYEKDSLHPKVLEEFAKEARRHPLDNPMDITFMQQIINQDGKALNRELIEFYLDSRLEAKGESYTNREIYQGLKKVLQKIKTGTPPKAEVRRMRRMIVE